MTVGQVVVLSVVLVAGWGFWALSFHLAAERAIVASPDGKPYDVLVHPDGVEPMTRLGVLFNGYTFRGLVGAMRRSRGRTGWVVRVRPKPFPGYVDLYHEVVATQEEARARARTVAIQISRGERLWPAEAEWFR